MIDLKVILHDIYYDTHVNFLDTPCFTPLACVMLRTYNTYLHGKCFRSAPYNDITSDASPHSKLLIVYSDSSPCVYAISQSSPLCTYCHIPCRNTVWSVYTVLLLSGPIIFEAVTWVIPPKMCIFL